MNIDSLLSRAGNVYQDKPAVFFADQLCVTYQQLAQRCAVIANNLVSKYRLQPGDRVAITSSNCPEYVELYFAIWHAGLVAVPVNAKLHVSDFHYVIAHSGARLCFTSEKLVKDISPLVAGIESFDQAITIGGREYLDLYQGEAMPLFPREPKDPAWLFYTSGTTGKPKGVVLSNRNVIETSRNSAEFDHLTRGEDILSYLPMAWVGDFIFSVGQAYWCGFCVNCPESADTMMTDLREIGPTYFFAPPRVFETQLTNVMIRMEDAGKLKKAMFHHFMAHARKVGPKILDGKPVGLWDRLKYALGMGLVYGPLKDTLGFSRVRVGYTAGEAIGPEIFDFYRSLGINLKQLYGQTEATVFITVQPDGEVRADTVGVPSPGVELKIGENGEVFYRSPGVFVEYYKNPESTASTKDAEGWVATGDAGFIEEDTGHLRIIDRAKDVGKMADGSLFAPKYVENKLKFYPNILEAVVFGNGRDECTAFINIDLSAVGNWAERNNIGYASYQELARHPKVMEMIQGHVEEVNRSVAEDPMLAGCQVHRFVVLHKELDADDGEMTRTRKVRRRIVEEKYHDIITALYDGSKEVSTVTEVTYEDGRKGSIRATLEIRDAKVMPVQHAMAAE